MYLAFSSLYPGKLTKVGATEVEESAVFISGAENSTAHQAWLDPSGGELPDLGPGLLAQSPLQEQRAAHLSSYHWKESKEREN